MKDEQYRTDQIRKLLAAVDELTEHREAFTPDTFVQLMIALYDKIRHYQTQRIDANLLGVDEIRLVTVVFIDVIGSTEIATRLETEDWKTLIGELHRGLGELVQEWRGEIGQYLGDGLLSFFGARHSQSNDAQRAVSCALAVQDYSREFATEVARKRYGLPAFSLRIGISTGRVVVGVIGTEAHAATLAVGSTTNLAARLQTICPPHGVAIDIQTYNRIRTEFLMEAKAPVTLKGFDKPVPYYLVLGRQQLASVSRGVDRIADVQIPFVGRMESLNHLIAIMNRALYEQAFQTVVISGEIGIGKSRFLQALIQHEIADPYYVIELSGHYDQRETAYGLLRDLLGQMCDLTVRLRRHVAERRIRERIMQLMHASDSDSVAAVIGYLAGYGFNESPFTEPLRKSSPEKVAQVAQRTLWRLLAILADGRPILLVVDNLQWVDRESVGMLTEMIERNQNYPGLLLMASRPEYLEGRMPVRIPEQYEHRELLPLAVPEIKQLIDSVLQHVEAVPADLPTLIQNRSEGNPLFVEEFLRMLFDNGIIEFVEDRWRVNAYMYATMAPEMPDGLFGVLQARFDDLSEASRRVIQIAAVVGRTFWSGAVAEMAGINVTNVMTEMVNRGIIQERPESRFEGEREYVFRNSLYYDVIYTMLARTSRTDYHRQAADWLSRRVWLNVDMLDVLAEHYVKAEQHERALITYAAAAHVQTEQGMFPEALKMIESGLSAARAVPRAAALPLTSQLWLLQAQALHTRHRYSEATASSQTAKMLLDELPDGQLSNERILAAVTLGNAQISLGRFEDALQALTDAYRRLDVGSGPALKATVLRAFGRLYWSRGSLDEAALYQQEALFMAEKSNDPRELAAVLSMLGRIAVDKGELSTALSYFLQVSEVNQDRNHLVYQVSDMRLIATIFRLIFDYRRSLKTLDEALDLQERIGHDDPLIMSNRGLCLIHLGDVELGLQAVQQANAHNVTNHHDLLTLRLNAIQALAASGCFQDCLDEAALFLDQVRDENPLMYGRALFWVGIAQYGLEQEQAATTLRWALNHEEAHGGLEIWRCHYGLSLISKRLPESNLFHRQQAEDTLGTIAASLHRYPELQPFIRLENAHLSIFSTPYSSSSL